MSTPLFLVAGLSTTLIVILAGHRAFVRTTRAQRWKQARRWAKGRRGSSRFPASPAQLNTTRSAAVSVGCAAPHGDMDALRHQIDPHFLFNALASISGCLPSDPLIAREMIEQLSEFYRLSLRLTTRCALYTVGEELDLMRSFLAIELMRSDDLLSVDIVCPATLCSERIPPLLLLPLVENALKYGRATSAERVGVRIVVWQALDSLHLEVANTGRWLAPDEIRHVPSLGIGLANVRARLAAHFPDRHSLECSSSDGWVKVSLRIFTPAAHVVSL